MGDLPTAVIHVEQYAALNTHDMVAIREEAAAIFRAAGITLVWAPPLLTSVDNAPTDGRCHFALVILNIQAPFADDAPDTADVLGRAAPTLRRAWVFVNRAAAVAATGKVSVQTLLARAIAHELGHLLLRSHAHSHMGIMRPRLELEQVGLHGFSRDQASAMRSWCRSAGESVVRSLRKKGDTRAPHSCVRSRHCVGRIVAYRL